MAKKKQQQPKKQKKGKKGGSARKPRAAPPVAVPRMVSSQALKKTVKMGHVHATCSMTDPFCVHARGAQRPDGGPPTIPYQVRGLVSVAGWSATGSTRYVFVPGVLYQYNAPSAAAGAVWTMGAAWVSFLSGSDILQSAKEVRIVSFGVILRSVLSATNASGNCIVSTTPQPLVSETYTSGTMNNAETQVHNVASGTEISWISKPMGPSAHLFKPLSSYTTTTADFDWTSLSVDISGSYTGASGATFMVAEYVCNLEFTLNPQSTGLANLAKAPSAPNRVAVAAADHLRVNTPSFISGGIEAVASKVEGYAKSALDSIMADGMALLFG